MVPLPSSCKAKKHYLEGRITDSVKREDSCVPDEGSEKVSSRRNGWWVKVILPNDPKLSPFDGVVRKIKET